jgi:thiol peroxidase
MKKTSIFLFSTLFATLLMGSDAVVDFNGEQVTVKGNFPAVGKKAPIVRVTEPNFSIKTIGGKSNRVQVIATVPSIETPICSAESKRFDDEIKIFPTVDMTVVSMDLPYADDRFCKGRGIKNITIASDFAYQEVGDKYGVSITDGELRGLLIRAIFIIGKNGRIVYQEIVPSIAQEPDYKKVMEAIKMADAQ